VNPQSCDTNKAAEYDLKTPYTRPKGIDFNEWAGMHFSNGLPILVGSH
jgi:hypothetical protein